MAIMHQFRELRLIWHSQKDCGMGYYHIVLEQWTFIIKIRLRGKFLMVSHLMLLTYHFILFSW